MTRRLLPVALLACLLLSGCARHNAPSSSIAASSGITPMPALPQSAPTPVPKPMQCYFYEPDLFLSGCAAPAPYESQGRLAAGIVPHHLLAADMLSGFFTLAANQPQGYDRVIVLSPSHFPQQCGSLITTATAGWRTPYGAVAGDSDVADALLAHPTLGAQNNPTAVERDHGAAGLIPYIAYYLPETAVTACLISPQLPAEQLDALYATLLPFLRDGRTLLVCSADASHYLKPDAAACMDLETAQAIENFDYAAVSSFTDNHIDSPQTVSLFMRTAQQMDVTPLQLGHASSEEKMPQQRSSEVFAQGITTYFVYGAFAAA